MALAAVQAVMHLEEKKSVHPFFSKPSKEQQPEPEPSVVEAPNDDTSNDPDYDQHTTTKPTKGRQKRARNPDNVKGKQGTRGPAKNQASLDNFARRPKDAGEDAAVDDEASADAPLKEDPNQDRRKRRKTVSPNPSTFAAELMQPVEESSLDWHQQLQTGADSVHSDKTGMSSEAALETDSLSTDALLPHSDLPLPPIPETAASVDSSAPADGAHCEPQSALPKKQIKVTKTGKLISSPPEPEPQPSSSTRTRRGRKPNKLLKTSYPSLMTVIKYGTDPSSKLAIGQQIDAILSGKASKKRAPPSKKASPKPSGPPKATHPFFSGKPGQKKDEDLVTTAVEQPPSNPKRSAVTPGKLQSETRREQPSESMPSFGISSRSNRSSKQAGLVEPSWPTKDSAHVRSLGDEDEIQQNKIPALPESTLKPRKLKRSAALLSVQEDAVAKLSQQLKGTNQRKDNLTSDFAPPEDVRLPTRLLTTGPEIQRRVRGQVQARLAGPDEEPRPDTKTHPAINEMFNDIEHTLTPFDKGECENQTWAQKYSPKCASHVLQAGKEASVLKDWLQNLTVMAVGGAHTSQKLNTAAEGRKPPKKKRKMIEDNFIVSDDEEEEEDMVELSDAGHTDPHQPRSLRRPKWTRNQNVILISGPHGCGKSATVYAVAKELDFEVFEINSGVRRSGKDIQDKVGDMTANHLVNHKRGGAPPEDTSASIIAAGDTDNERMDDELQKDLDSGRQGTMTSFFKMSTATKPKPQAKSKVQEAKKPVTSTAQATLPITQAARKSQKQSLILIEEADVIFDEDQHFWAQITKLAAQSKRPIVITCNDELQIPVDNLPLGALLRLSVPPVDLATDYLLVLAGREGHILDRRAVRDLYESKHRDLRASITELDFWCQMSVGDRKGGLEWMYQRWPPGKDVDAYGRLLRVASEETYQTGMGMLSHNIFESKDNISFDKEEELLKESWQDWGISPEQWTGACKLGESPATRNGNVQDPRLKNLDRLSAFADVRSAADVCYQVDLPSYKCMHDQPIDPTIPPMAIKDRQNYTIAAPVLHVDTQTDYLNMDTSFSTQTELLVRRVFPDFVNSQPVIRPSAAEPETQYAKHILSLKHAQNTDTSLSRSDYSTALDILATPPDYVQPERTSFLLALSSFDRAFSVITLDLAPYIRSIVNHELALETQRIRLGNLLSEGGSLKRSRNTRASRTALEGGTRQTKRRERWFPSELDFEQVLKTAGRSWSGLGWKGEGAEEESGSLTGTHESMDGVEASAQVIQEHSDQV